MLTGVIYTQWSTLGEFCELGDQTSRSVIGERRLLLAEHLNILKDSVLFSFSLIYICC